MLLGQFPWADLYLLHMPEGSVIQPHTDPLTEGRHHRVNLLLKRPKRGGEFRVRGPVRSWLRGRLRYFRPDCVEYEVTEVGKSSRWVLSIGWKTS